MIINEFNAQLFVGILIIIYNSFIVGQKVANLIFTHLTEFVEFRIAL